MSPLKNPTEEHSIHEFKSKPMSVEECSSVVSYESIDIEPSVADRILEFEKLIRLHSGLPYDASGVSSVLACASSTSSICHNWLFRRAQLASGRKWIGSRISLLSSTSGYTSDCVTTPPPLAPPALEGGLLLTDEELDEEIHWSDFETADDADIDDVNDIGSFATSLHFHSSASANSSRGCFADSEVDLINIIIGYVLLNLKRS